METSLPKVTRIAQLQHILRDDFLRTLRALGASESATPKIIFSLPPGEVRGADLSIVVFPFAKDLKKKPDEVAALVSERIVTESAIVASASPSGPYVNIRIESQVLGSAAIGQILLSFEQQVQHATLGPDDEKEPTQIGKGKHMVVEFSSPNTNKPQHLGHVRNNVLGDSTSRIYEYTGYRVTKVNLVNDRGIHICKSMLAYKKFGNGETPESAKIKGDHLVGKYYVLFENFFSKEYKEFLESSEGKESFEKWKVGSGRNELEKNANNKVKAEKIKDEAKRKEALSAIKSDWEIFTSKYKELYFNNESQLGREASEMLVRWEANDPETRDLWNMMNGWVFQGFDQTYKALGISFDHIDKESVTYLLGKEIVEDGLKNGLLEKLPNGAIACDLDKMGLKGEGKKVLLRANGTSVYMTQDLGTAMMRQEKFNPDRLVYVVASEQDRHFLILFRIVERLNPKLKDRLYHLSYGMVNLPTGRMKSREGTVVDADDLIAELEREALEATKTKWPELSEEEAQFRANKIGLAALKYFILRYTPKAVVTFDPKSSIDFKGNTGPYLLYTYARTRSILRKAGFLQTSVDHVPAFEPDALATLGTEEERGVLMALYEIPASIVRAVETYDPSRIAEATYHLARRFNEFYRDKEKHAVVNCPDQRLKSARLQLVLSLGIAIKQGLSLLGIEALESM